jgi:hypothetical protein
MNQEEHLSLSLLNKQQILQFTHASSYPTQREGDAPRTFLLSKGNWLFAHHFQKTVFHTRKGHSIMTTIVNTTVATINLPSYQDQNSFDYDACIEQCKSTKKSVRAQGLKNLKMEVEVRAEAAYKRVTNMAKKTNGYAHFASQTRLRKIASTYGQMLVSLKKMQSPDCTKETFAKEIAKFENHHVLTTPYYDQFSMWDAQTLLVGIKEDSQRNGIASYELADYAFLAPHQEGILLTINGEQHLIGALEAHNLIIKGMENSHPQNIPYTKSGVMATTYATINYDGLTMIVKNASFTNMTDGEVYTFETIRLSMPGSLYTALFSSVAYGCYYQEKNKDTHQLAKYRLHGEVTTKMYGGNTLLPENAMEILRFEILYTTTYKSEHGVVRAQTEKEQASWFEKGRRGAYYGLSNIEDILDPKRFAACVTAAEAARQQQAKERAAQRSDASTRSEEEQDQLDEHPF